MYEYNVGHMPPGIDQRQMKRLAPVLTIAALLSACAVLREKPAPVLVTPIQTAEQLVLLDISPTAVELITEYTGDIKPNTNLSQYMDSIGDQIEKAVKAKLVRYGFGLIVSLPARGEHTPRFNELLPALQRAPGLQVWVVGNSAFVDASPQCARVRESARKAVTFLLRHNVLSPRMLSYVACDEIPTIAFGRDDWERDEHLEFVLFPSRAFADSFTKADGARAQSKN
jgi:hypothetical protein